MMVKKNTDTIRKTRLTSREYTKDEAIAVRHTIRGLVSHEESAYK